MTICDVCCEHHNKINHKKVECPFCDLSSCRSCSQRYILSSFEDPHCMGCKTLWNREFVDLFCTKYFRNTELKRHREVVLFEREKARMPETQPEVERILQMKKVYISDYMSDNSINHKRDIPLFYDLFYCDVHNIRRIWSLT